MLPVRLYLYGRSAADLHKTSKRGGRAMPRCRFRAVSRAACYRLPGFSKYLNCRGYIVIQSRCQPRPSSREVDMPARVSAKPADAIEYAKELTKDPAFCQVDYVLELS